MKPEEALQAELQKIRYLEAQIGALKQQMDLLLRTLNEISNTKSVLDNFTEEKEGFVSLGAGVLARAKIPAQDVLLVDVGSGVLVEKPVSEVKKELTKKEVALKQELEKIRSVIAQLQQEYEKSVGVIQKLSQGGAVV